MPESKQRVIKSDPINKRQNKVNGYLHISQSVPLIKLGGNTFKKQGVILKIGNEPIIALCATREGNLSMSLKLYDQSGLKVLEILDNEWASGDYLAWDIIYKLNFLKLRYKKGDIGIEVDARKTPMELLGSLWFRGQSFLLKPSSLLFDGVIKKTTFNNCEFENIYLEVDLEEKSLKIKSESIPAISMNQGAIEFGKNGPSITGTGTISGLGTISAV